MTDQLAKTTAQSLLDSAPDEVLEKSVLQRLLRSPLAVFSFILILGITIFGVIGPLVLPNSPFRTVLELTHAPPGSSTQATADVAAYLLGGDHTGRDILARLAAGTTSTLLCSVVLLAVAITVGTPSGLIAGYFRGPFDTVASWLSDALMSFPGVVLLIALYGVIGPNILLAMAVFGLLIAPGFYRLARTETRNIRNELYVDAAKVAGLTHFRIISRHVLRSIRGPVIVMAAGILPAGIGIMAGLEFLGLGDPSEASWGVMLQDGLSNIYSSPLPILWPTLLISITTLAMVLFGNVLRDVVQSTTSESLQIRPRAQAQLRTEAHSQASSVASEDGPGGALLQVRDLVIGYPLDENRARKVVKGISFDVHEGEVHGLVGESGSGKTQTAFSILGTLPRTAVVLGGSIVFDGDDLLVDGNAQRTARGRRIAYIPQEPMANLDPMYTVGAQLVFGIRSALKMSRAEAREHALDLLRKVEIRDPQKTFDSYPHQISGGMAQRVLIAGAIAPQPNLLIADEPTTALDVTVQAEVLDLLRELQAESNMAMVLVTHNFGVVADICDSVSVMKEGQIVETNSVEQLFAAPQHEYTYTLLSSNLDDAPLRPPYRDTHEEDAHS